MPGWPSWRICHRGSRARWRNWDECLSPFPVTAWLCHMTLTGIQHGEVVIGFGQLRIVIGQSREYFDGISGLALLGEYQSFKESRLRVFRLVGEIAIYLVQSLTALALLEQLVGIFNVIGICANAGTQQQRAGEQYGMAVKMVKYIHSGSVPECRDPSARGSLQAHGII